MSTPRPTQRPAGRRPQDGPPVLDFDLASRLKGVLLANGIAILVLGIGGALVATGRIALRPEAKAGLIPLAVMVAACAVLAVSCWLLLPLSTWLRAWPRWHYHHGSKVLWALPYAIGAVARVVIRVVAALAALAALVLVGLGLVRLYEISQGFGVG